MSYEAFLVYKMKGGEMSGNQKNSNIEKKVSLDPASEVPIISWSSLDYSEEERGPRWYILVVLATVILSIFLYWQKIYSGLVLVVVFSISLLVTSRTKPKNIKSSIYKSGIVVDGQVFSFSNIKSFGLVNSVHPKIKLRQNGFFGREISAPVANVDISKIRELLIQNLPEEEFSEDLSDIVNRIFKL